MSSFERGLLRVVQPQAVTSWMSLFDEKYVRSGVTKPGVGVVDGGHPACPAGVLKTQLQSYGGGVVASCAMLPSSSKTPAPPTSPPAAWARICPKASGKLAATSAIPDARLISPLDVSERHVQWRREPDALFGFLTPSANGAACASRFVDIDGPPWFLASPA